MVAIKSIVDIVHYAESPFDLSPEEAEKSIVDIVHYAESPFDLSPEEAEKRLDELFCEAFDTNHPAMLAWVSIKFELKRLRRMDGGNK